MYANAGLRFDAIVSENGDGNGMLRLGFYIEQRRWQVARGALACRASVCSCHVATVPLETSEFWPSASLGPLQTGLYG